MKGITSGLRPVVKLREGGFPDLTGDGKVTQKDILRGRGIEGFAEGGDANSGFINMQRTAEGSGANLRDFTDFIFDPTDPVDYALLPLLAFPPAAIAARLIKMGVKGAKLEKSLKKVEMLKNAEKTNGAKITDLVKGDASPTELVAAANGLILGPTRQGVLGAAGQMTARNEVADLIPHDKSGVPVVGNKKYEGNITKMPITGQELYSYEARDELKKNPNMYREEGLPGLYDFAKEVPSMVSEISQEVSKDPGVLKNLVPEGILGVMGVDPEDFYVYEEEPMEMARGGIAYLAKGGGAKKIAPKIVEKIKPKKRPANPKAEPKAAPAAPKGSGPAIKKKIDESTPPIEPIKPGANVSPGSGSGRPFYKKKRYIVPAGIAGASFLPGDGDDEDRPLTIDPDKPYTPPVVVEPGDEVLSDEFSVIIKDNLIANGAEVDDKGNFIKKPKFMDYLKVLPSSYSDKVSRDPDFAKKMIAGFLNMMRPVEGFVPVNSAVAFGDAYFGEETRQADMMSADSKLLEYLSDNPDMLKAYKQINASKAGYDIGKLDSNQARELFSDLRDALLRDIPIDQQQNYMIRDKNTGRPVSAITISGMAQEDAAQFKNLDNFEIVEIASKQ
jgi:hypothetical protein